MPGLHADLVGDRGAFQVPCHGSNFLLNGQNVAGPAPVPRYRAAIRLDLAGNIVVSKSQQENQPGEHDTPPFFLPLPHASRAIQEAHGGSGPMPNLLRRQVPQRWFL